MEDDEAGHVGIVTPDVGDFSDAVFGIGRCRFGAVLQDEKVK